MITIHCGRIFMKMSNRKTIGGKAANTTIFPWPPSHTEPFMTMSECGHPLCANPSEATNSGDEGPYGSMATLSTSVSTLYGEAPP